VAPAEDGPATRALLLGAFQAAVEAVSAPVLLPRHLPPPPRGKLYVVAVGKAAAAMAAAAEDHYGQDVPLAGLALTRHGHGWPTRSIQVIEAGHPLPDGAGLAAAETMLNLVRDARPEDHILALLSGGGSSLLTLPLPGLNLADLRQTTDALLLSGAPIDDINCVRKHLSATLGGRLAQISRAPVTALMLSDVVGDAPSVIASGPFSPDPTTFRDALAVLASWRVTPADAVDAYLRQGAAGRQPETPKPGAACFNRVHEQVIGNGATALAGAGAWLVRQGVDVQILGDHFSGEARDLAHAFANTLANTLAAAAPNADPRRTHPHCPLALLSGGEAQVTVHGPGRGGRNGEFLLALALELARYPDLQKRMHALAADTDGIDGQGDNAGAVIGPDTLSRAEQAGMSAQTCLESNDAWGFFSRLADLVVTGPTRTNANDFRMLLIP